jgi:two-component system nitrate/nitrite response regulator NarL
MPKMDGVEATSHIRAEFPFIQILGFSIYPRTEGPHAIELAGAEGFSLAKASTRSLINCLSASPSTAGPGCPTTTSGRRNRLG